MSKRIRHPKKHFVPSQPIALKVGDSVIIKPGVEDPDFGGDIGGWQGRVTELRADQQGVPLIDLQWDSLTLRKIPPSAIEHCEEEGLDWSTMGLYAHDVEHAQPRDKPRDVERALAELASQHAFAYLGEQGRRIRKALAQADEEDDMDAFAAWSDYLEEHLAFPFEAEVSEFQERGPLRVGDRVKVTGIRDIEDLYGILVDVRMGHRKFVFPLCDLKAVDQKSSNYELTDDYAVWFANR